MSLLSVYRFFSRNLRVSYRAKFLLAVWASAYVPAAAVVFYVVVHQAEQPCVWFKAIWAAAVTVVAGSVLTVMLIVRMLEPIAMTSRSLRSYAADGVLPELPAGFDAEFQGTDATIQGLGQKLHGGDSMVHFKDDLSQLLAVAHHTIHHMDRTLKRLTEFDQVTGLPNRKVFQREVALKMQANRHFALCAMCLGNYDMIASAFGQEAIDTACRNVAARFVQVLDPGTRIARTSAKMFFFEIELAGSSQFLESQVEEIRLKMQQEPSLPSYNVYPELNAGVSIFHGQEINAETLMNEAISAMAETGRTARGTTHFFSPEQRLAARNALLLERDLRMAVERKQLSMFYQPIVNLTTGRVVGAEALVRWTHPERGLISPGVFIPMAEKNGLIDEIGIWILGEVCRQLGEWSLTELRDIKVSVNLSATQFLRSDAVQQILNSLAVSSVEGRMLEVELTETTMIENRDRTLRALDEFRAHGITTAIDDFGAGFSSLSYLKTMAFDRIKIDRDFIRDVDKSSKSSAICKSLIELAKGLKIEVLAEGTETIAEVERLRELGCSLFQGYYFARPVPPERFAEAVSHAEAILRVHRFPFMDLSPAQGELALAN